MYRCGYGFMSRLTKVMTPTSAPTPYNDEGAINRTELYDPLTKLWTTTKSNGNVLFVGGDSTDGLVKFYDPRTGNWTITRSLNIARIGHTTSVLTNGDVLESGGRNRSKDDKTSEIYDVLAGIWTISSDMNCVRYEHQSSILRNETVLVTGVTDRITLTGDVELY
ncbi:unnamed protein product [Adineta steineri]|uniref:Uncharacterized protein n=1 Tax=Adineta steineri TaxID=433720 RepID=A0A819XJZ4_9BILA|nr:unnamed protein product [Adineta steineri]CAF4140751.1 unnamed protein product [Adineta steineri]